MSSLPNAPSALVSDAPWEGLLVPTERHNGRLRWSRATARGTRPDTAHRAHAGGVLVMDETGDRQWGTKTAHVGRQDLDSLGTIANGGCLRRSLWTDAHMYDPLEGEPYTPTQWFAKGKHDTDVRTKPPMASA